MQDSSTSLNLKQLRYFPLFCILEVEIDPKSIRNALNRRTLVAFIGFIWVIMLNLSHLLISLSKMLGVCAF